METPFDPELFKSIKKRASDTKGKNGQVTIIGGSDLFHGAPILSLIAASRIVDMVFFSSPEKSVGHVAELMKSKLMSFIWVPWGEVERYITKSDACLIGPGLMSYRKGDGSHGTPNHACDDACRISREITRKFLTEFSDKPWVIDAGSLQVMDTAWIPEGSVLTPNRREYELLFGDEDPQKIVNRYHCAIVKKGAESKIYSEEKVVSIDGGNKGLVRGGTGDVLAGVAVSLLTGASPLVAGACADFVVKRTADRLKSSVGDFFNADDLANEVPKVLKDYLTI